MDEAFHTASETWDQVFKVPYVVELLNWPELPPAQRAALEVHFAAALEERFGGADGMVRAFFEHEMAWEEHDAQSGPETSAITTPWETAEAQAKRLAFEGLNPPTAARFWFSFFDQVYERPE